MFRNAILAAALTLLAAPVLADEIEITQPYLRVSTPMSKSAAAFMEIRNTTGRDDRLVSASSDVAARVELHTHLDMGNGVVKMAHVKEGFPIPSHGEHALARGGDHIMFMGLHHRLQQGEMVRVTLHFQKAGDMTIEVPVDMGRSPNTEMDPVTHGGINHGDIGHGEPGHADPTLNTLEGDM